MADKSGKNTAGCWYRWLVGHFDVSLSNCRRCCCCCCCCCTRCKVTVTSSHGTVIASSVGQPIGLSVCWLLRNSCRNAMYWLPSKYVIIDRWQQADNIRDKFLRIFVHCCGRILTWKRFDAFNAATYTHTHACPLNGTTTWTHVSTPCLRPPGTGVHKANGVNELHWYRRASIAKRVATNAVDTIRFVALALARLHGILHIVLASVTLLNERDRSVKRS